MRHSEPQVHQRDQHPIDELQFRLAPGSCRALAFATSLLVQF
jgi:hypothetical protein